MKAIRIHPDDNVAVAVEALPAGLEVLGVTLAEAIPAGHKFALQAIPSRTKVIKYAYSIGDASGDIQPGQWVHTHNVVSDMEGPEEYEYKPVPCALPRDREAAFQGYLRPDGRAGIRNEIWIVPTVGCVNGIAQQLANRAQAAFGSRVDGVYAFGHPYGCSQLGEDMANTQRLLAAMVNHPNAGAVLVLGLGCENNHIAAFQEVLGTWDEQRVRFLNVQDVHDEFEAGMEALEALAEYAGNQKRVPVSAEKLVIGLKCGGSDGFSGLSANPLLGRFSDLLIRHGGATLLTEVPEMFGAEEMLFERCVDRATFDRAVAMINDFKRYFHRYGQRVDKNPSPGNHAGGLTTNADKSLGCTQKAGHGPVAGVLDLYEPVQKPGLHLVPGPGNDLCAVTALMAAGAQLILFTTGRGTPLGSPVPTLKVSTNSALAQNKPHWIDFDAGPILQGAPMEREAEALLALVLECAGGKPVRNEENGYREITIFKDGVTL